MKVVKAVKLQKLEPDFTICKVSSVDQVDLSCEYVFLARTPDEISLVCETSQTPDEVLEREDGWKAFVVAGTLDFGLVGIIARISSILAEAKISLFVVSTYNTDYVLLKVEDFARGLKLLAEEGYQIS